MRLHLIAGCLLSLGVHAGFFLLVPALSRQPLPVSELPMDTELLVRDLPLPPAEQTFPLVQSPSHGEEPQALPSTVTYDATKIVPPDIQQIDSAIDKMRAGTSAPFSMPLLQLPTPRQAEDASELLLSLPHNVGAMTTAMVEQSLLSPGLMSSVEKQGAWGQVRLGEKQSPGHLGLPMLDPELMARSLPSPPSGFPFTAPLPQPGIQGPAAKREPLYRPPLPQVQVSTESEITLKFWVRPDGVVSRVLPERKGDTALEATAMRYLEGWRFTPLSPQEPQVDQWGMITVRFLLHER